MGKSQKGPGIIHGVNDYYLPSWMTRREVDGGCEPSVGGRRMNCDTGGGTLIRAQTPADNFF